MDKLASEYKVLIVDDVPTNVMLVQAILKKEGYTLLTCDSGTKALRIANEKHPNLILLDIMMPEMDGYEVLQHLKSNPEIADNLEAEIRRNFDKLMTGQSRVAAKAAGRAVDVSADDFKDED